LKEVSFSEEHREIWRNRRVRLFVCLVPWWRECRWRTMLFLWIGGGIQRQHQCDNTDDNITHTHTQINVCLRISSWCILHQLQRDYLRAFILEHQFISATTLLRRCKFFAAMRNLMVVEGEWFLPSLRLFSFDHLIDQGTYGKCTSIIGIIRVITAIQFTFCFTRCVRCRCWVGGSRERQIIGWLGALRSLDIARFLTHLPSLSIESIK
jgi:hypothetical protein